MSALRMYLLCCVTDVSLKEVSDTVDFLICDSFSTPLCSYIIERSRHYFLRLCSDQSRSFSLKNDPPLLPSLAVVQCLFILVELVCVPEEDRRRVDLYHPFGAVVAWLRLLKEQIWDESIHNPVDPGRRSPVGRRKIATTQDNS